MSARPVGRARRDEPEQEAAIVDGMAPPHDIEAEAAVLSAVLIDPKAYPEVGDMLSPEDFYSEAHRRIFEACAALDAAGSAIDVVLVGSWLKNAERMNQVGGYAYLTEVLDAAPFVANVRAYATKIVSAARLRRMIASCQRVAAHGYQPEALADAEQFMETALGEFTSIAIGRTEDRLVSVKTVMHETYQAVKHAWEEGKPPGIPTGFTGWDRWTSGLHRSDLTIIAGRPGMGKTQFALSALMNALFPKQLVGDDAKIAGAFFSLEMPRQQAGLRMLSAEGRIALTKLRANTMVDGDWPHLTRAASMLAGLPLHIDDTPSLHVNALRAKIKRLRMHYAAKGYRLSIVVIDYLQLMRGSTPGDKMNREQEISYISRSLKAIGKEEDLAIIALSQLNRSVDTRGGDKRPGIADLRESGAIEQDADNIVFLYRPEYYREAVDPEDEGVTEVDVAKQRNGPTGTGRARFINWCVRFEDCSQEVFTPEPYIDTDI